MTGGQHKQPISMDRSVVGGAHESVAEGQTDYQKRRQRERDIDAGKPVSRQPKNPQNDYFARRKKEKKHDMAEQTDKSGSPMYRREEVFMIVHNGKEVAFYKPANMKQAYDDAEALVKKFGGEAHVKKVMREMRQTCPECGGDMWPSNMLAEKQDACYYKVKSRYKVWPSAYASGALVQCRKKGAANWGEGGKKK